MSLSCNAVQDLVTLYKDKTVSFETQLEINEHLSQCEDCRRFYKQYDRLYKTENVSGDSTNLPPHEQDYSSVAKKLKTRETIRDLLFAAAILASAGVTLAVAKSIWDSEKDML